ncbi:hypothetical protein LOY24_04525 [Pseudomonas putida]|uniref:hypothetical protein n=1 Tax=Pseudomonas putida TaxID=303 RepID=UPI00215F52E4|nr:hypothetical protein [Pseudomonas putida]UVL79410.1 hypothetical protein LOY24_04525 [Pseudomonas putida]
MDWKQFFAALVNSSAWPIATVVLVLMLRSPLAKLIPRIRSVKYGQLDVDLSEKLDEVETAVAADVDHALPKQSPQPGVLELARIDPRAAVLSAWLEVEKEVQRLAIKAEISYRGDTPMSVANKLHVAGLMDELTFTTFRKLRKIRNEAAHLTEIGVSFEEAVSMANLCQWLAARLAYESAHLAAQPPQPSGE